MTRPLGKDRAHAFETIFPQISIPEDFFEGKGGLKPSSLFKEAYKEYWMEIGFGGGEHLVALRDKNPEVAFIGAEPFINGMAALCQLLEPHKDDGLDNTRVFNDDAILMVSALESESLQRIYILNPDPWPKNRHEKRRIMRRENLDEFVRVLKPGGLLCTCTDVAGLANWMTIQLANHPALEWTANSCSDWKNPPPGWASTTRYREKGAKAGRKMTYLIFKKACQRV